MTSEVAEAECFLTPVLSIKSEDSACSLSLFSVSHGQRGLFALQIVWEVV